MKIEAVTEGQVEMTGADSKDQSQDAGKESVAEVLIAAREAMQMTQQDLATALFLDVDVVRIIEQGRYTEIVKQVYLRGYLRSIAKVVNLDGQYIVDLYDAESESYRSDVVIERATDEGVENRFTGPVFKTGMLASALFFVLLAVTWLLIDNAGDPPSVKTMDSLPEQAEVTNQIVAKQAAPKGGAVIQTDSESKVILPIQNAVALSEVVEQPEEPQTSIEVAAASNESAVEMLASEPQLTTALIEQIQPDTRLSKNIITEVTDLEIGVLLEIDAGGTAEIEIIFSGECWLEIVDAQRESVYSDLNGAGDIIRLKGLAPFELLFGNAPVARLYYQGELIDLSRRITKEFTARITLPAGGTNS